jgi:uncharacterized protein YxjI
VYEITRDDHHAANVWRTALSAQHCRFTLDVPGDDDPVAEGDFERSNYTIRLHGRRVAKVSPEKDGWCIDIERDQDDILLIAAAVVIDLMTRRAV